MLQALEDWRPVVGYEGLYDISNFGNVYSVPRVVTRSNGVPQTIKGGLLNPCLDGFGYPTVTLRKNAKPKQFRVHTLLLTAFVGERPDGLEALHADDVKTNCTLDNLRWGTRIENHVDAARNGHAWWVKGYARGVAAE